MYTHRTKTALARTPLALAAGGVIALGAVSFAVGCEDRTRTPAGGVQDTTPTQPAQPTTPPRDPATPGTPGTGGGAGTGGAGTGGTGGIDPQ
jgi:hypothetical protein